MIIVQSHPVSCIIETALWSVPSLRNLILVYIASALSQCLPFPVKTVPWQQLQAAHQVSPGHRRTSRTCRPRRPKYIPRGCPQLYHPEFPQVCCRSILYHSPIIHSEKSIAFEFRSQEVHSICHVPVGDKHIVPYPNRKCKPRVECAGIATRMRCWQSQKICSRLRRLAQCNRLTVGERGCFFSELRGARPDIVYCGFKLGCHGDCAERTRSHPRPRAIVDERRRG